MLFTLRSPGIHSIGIMERSLGAMINRHIDHPSDSISRFHDLFGDRGRASRDTSFPPRDAAVADRGNPWRFHRSAKWAKAMDGFFRVNRRTMRRSPTVETLDVSTGRPSGQRPWMALPT